jgi:hypothetical protein
MAQNFYEEGVLDFESKFLKSRISDSERYDGYIRPIYAQVIQKENMDVNESEFDEIVGGRPSTRVVLEKARKIKSIIVQLTDFDHLNKTLQMYWYDPSIVNAIHYLVVNLVVLDRNNPCEILARPLFKMVNNMTTGLGGFVYEVVPMESKLSLVLKTPYTIIDSEELRNEAAITRLSINGLRELTPNFSVMMGNFECGPSYWGTRSICEGCENIYNYTLYEFVKGVTIYDYIIDPNSELTMSQILSIIVQIHISLTIAYEKGYQFTHGDLHLDNIMMRKLDGTQLIPYESKLLNPLATGYSYILTNECPTIIDYGRSRIKYPLDPKNPEVLSTFGEIHVDTKLPPDFDSVCSRISDLYRLVRGIYGLLISAPRKNISPEEIQCMESFIGDYFFEPNFSKTNSVGNTPHFAGAYQYNSLKAGKISHLNFFGLLQQHFGLPMFESFFFYKPNDTAPAQHLTIDKNNIPVLHSINNPYTSENLFRDSFPPNMRVDYSNADLIRLSKFFRFQQRDAEVEAYVRSKRQELIDIFKRSYQPVAFFGVPPHKEILTLPMSAHVLDVSKWGETYVYLQILQQRISYYYNLLWVYHAIHLDDNPEGFELGKRYIAEVMAFKEHYEKSVYPIIFEINKQGQRYYTVKGGREFLIEFAKTARSMPPRIKFT